MLKPLMKRAGKQEREFQVLLGLVEYYIRTGKPVSSNTLKDAGFENLSSATIRNYFCHLEEKGFLAQAHSSGGRTPTSLALKSYANHYFDEQSQDFACPELEQLRHFDSREIASYLQMAADQLSQLTQCAVFLSAPRFDHDFITDIKLIALDAYRCLCIIITDFGLIQTEILQVPSKLSNFATKRMESYFQWRLKGIKPQESLASDEEILAKTLYNELILRYIVGYSTFVEEDIYRTGFSRLLIYPECQDASVLANGLSLFEDVKSMRLLLRESKALKILKCWIGEDLARYTNASSNYAALVIPYSINHHPVGAVGILGPVRLPYRILFKQLQTFATYISETLTRMIHKFKIDFRQPESGKVYLSKEDKKCLGQSRLVLLEDQRDNILKSEEE